MITSILGGIQTLVNLLFLVVVLGTVLLSWWLSAKYRRRYAAFPWSKACIILAIEILVWIGFNIFWSFFVLGFNIFWSFFVHNWWIVGIAVVIILVIVTKSRKKNDII